MMELLTLKPFIFPIEENKPCITLKDLLDKLIDLPGASVRMDAEVKADIQQLDFDMINSRKLNVKCLST